MIYNENNTINLSAHRSTGNDKLLAEPCVHSPVGVTSFFDAVQQLSSISLEDDYDSELRTDDYLSEPLHADYYDGIYKDPLPSKRRIRFKCHDDGEIDEDLSEHSFPDYELTPDIIDECWYTKKDRKANKAAIPGKCLRMINPQYRRATLQLQNLATHKDCVQKIKQSVRCQAAVEVVSHPAVRGFEKVMASQMMMPRKPAKQYSRDILLLQEMLYDDLEIRTTDDIWDEIADLHKMNSEQSVNWALMLAEGDAMYAHDYLTEDAQEEVVEDEENEV